MPLTCICDYDYVFEPGDWYFEFINSDIDFHPLADKEKTTCISCGCDIKNTDTCLSFPRVRYPKSDEEAKSCGYDDLEDAMGDAASIKCDDLHQCEKCGEIWLNLQEVGFECLSPIENMQQALKEYKETYNPGKI